MKRLLLLTAILSLPAALLLSGCVAPLTEANQSTYYQWLQTIPPRPLWLTIESRLPEQQSAWLYRAARNRLEVTSWFSEIDASPRPGGYHLRLDCRFRNGTGQGGTHTVQAEVSWVLGRRNRRGESVTAAGRIRQVASQQYGRDYNWLRREAFRQVIEGIIRSLSEQMPLERVRPIKEVSPLGLTVAPFTFEARGQAFQHGLGMAGTYVSNGLAASHWMEVLAPRNLDILLKEFNFARSDTSEQRHKKLTRMLQGADLMLFGTVAEHSRCMEIDVRLVDVSTGAIVKAVHGGVYRPGQIQSACNALVNHLTGGGLKPLRRSAPRVAVVLVSDQSPEAVAQELGAAFASALTTAFSQREELCVVERIWIEQVLKERNLRSSDAVARNASELGRLLVADYLVVGDVSDDSLSISVIDINAGGAKLPLPEGGSVHFRRNRSVWLPATEVARRTRNAIISHSSPGDRRTPAPSVEETESPVSGEHLAPSEP
ncbi:MAG: CsgG/HfaB family protein [Planctomycetota bacterium]